MRLEEFRDWLEELLAGALDDDGRPVVAINGRALREGALRPSLVIRFPRGDLFRVTLERASEELAA